MLALDVDSIEETRAIFQELHDVIGAVKIGPRLVYRYGADLVTELSQKTSVFVDNKYFDIPSTMLSAIRATFDAGATFATVHALSGHEALTQLAALEKELNKIRPFKILAVTILTSWDEKSLPPNMQPWSVAQHVRSLAEQVKNAGLSGLVCSAHELDLLKDLNLFKVTPGIRLEVTATENHGDQKRVMAPKEAIAVGANALVIGRPILAAKNRRQKVQEILKSLNS